MMYPRLKLARNLLTDDGVIFISIDDNEQENLKKICDEIFGEDNFIANFIRNTGATRAMAKYFDIRHDYVLIYSKKYEKLLLNEKENKEIEAYLNLDNDTNGKWSSQDLTVRTGGYEYEVPSIDGTTMFKRKWRFSEKALKEKLGGNETESFVDIYKKAFYIKEKDWYSLSEFVFKGKNKIINHKKYAKDVGTLKNHTLYNEVGSNKGASNVLYLTLGNNSFETPKPVELLNYLSYIGSSKNSIILDFFSGSATTAHAVMQLNAEDGGNRKYIMVQLPEPCDEKSEAYKAGYKNICEIGKERIRRAGEKIKADESLPLENREKLDIGFKVFKLDSSNIKEWAPETDDLKQTLLDSIDNIKSDRNSLDVLYEIILKYGLELTVPIEENEHFYSIGGGTLLINLDKKIDMEVIDSICEEYRNLLEIDEDFKTTVVLRDSAFKNDVDKTNAMKKLEQVGIKEVRSI